MISRKIYLISLIVLLNSTPLSGEPQKTGKPGGTQQMRRTQAESERTISEAGLGHLSTEDQEKILKLLANTVEMTNITNKKTVDLAYRAEQYFEAEGFKATYLKIISIKGENWLVVNNGLSSFATKDLPSLFPVVFFKEGFYFCKPALMGGIVEMIDDSGQKQLFSFANWENLR